MAFSWFIQTITIVVSFMAIFGLLLPMMPYSIACLFACLSLVAIELLKRLTFKPSVKEYLQFKKFPVFPLSLAFTMLGVSLWLTWNGTHETIFALTAKPNLLNVDSLTGYEKERIKQINGDISTAKKITWKGKLTDKGQKMIDRLMQERANIQAKLDTKESNLNTKNEQTTTDHFQHTSTKAAHFKYLTLCLDLLLFGLLAWLEYYDYRSLTEFSKLKTATKTNPNATQRKNTTQSVSDIPIIHETTTQSVVTNALRNNPERIIIRGFRRDEKQDYNAIRSPLQTPSVVRNPQKFIDGEIIIVKKACEHCSESFERRTTFQRFCTERCRIKAWEKRTGKKFRKLKNNS